MNSPMHRDYCIDALKMLLIALVIYGHIPLLDGLINEGVSIECDSITWSAVRGGICFSHAIVCIDKWLLHKKKNL